MDKKILLTLILFSTGCIYQPGNTATFSHTKQIWVKIQNTAGYHVSLRYDSDEYANAYADSNAVYITKGMLRDCQNDDQLAMVLGHELGHYVSQHYRLRNSSHSELEADKIGYRYCSKAGYKKCKGFFQRMKNLYGEEGQDGVHPTWSKRLENL